MGLEIVLAAISATLTVVSTVVALLAPEPSVEAGNRSSEEESGFFPYRWIFGRARIRGLPVWHIDVDPPGKKFLDIHQVILIAEGSIEEIERVWIGGEEITFTRSTVNANQLVGSGDWENKFWLWEHFRGDGTDLPRFNDASSPEYIDLSDRDNRNSQILWTDDHRLEGISWVHFHAKSDVGKKIKPTRQDRKQWKQFPRDLDFLVKGSKLTWLGSPVPTWTENPTEILSWFYLNRLEMIEDQISMTSFTASQAKCEEPITYTDVQLPDEYVDAGFDRITKRYTCNGIYQDTDDNQDIEIQIVRAMAGRVIDFNGQTHILAGARPAPVGSVNAPEDLVGKYGTFSPGVALQSRGNAFSMRLAQSAQDDFTPQPVSDYEDMPAQNRDKSRLVLDLGVSRFINNRIQGARVLAIQAREIARGTAAFGYRVNPGPNFERLAWMAGDHVLLNDPGIGLTSLECVIDKASVDKDLSLVLELVEYDTNTHDDTLVAPALQPRLVDFGVPSSEVPLPSNVVVTSEARVQGDGFTLLYLRASWLVHNSSIVTGSDFRIRKIGQTQESEWIPISTLEDPPLIVPLLDTLLVAGNIAEYQLRHVSPNYNTSEWTPIRTIVITGDSGNPINPTDVRVRGLPSSYEVTWEYSADSDYSYTEIMHRIVSRSDPFTLVAKLNGSFHVQPAEAEETYEVQVTHFDLSGNASSSIVVAVTTSQSEDGIIRVERDPTTGVIQIIYGTANWQVLVANTGNTTRTYQDTGLMADMLRNYRVSAINAVGTGPPSTPEDAQTDS